MKYGGWPLSYSIISKDVPMYNILAYYKKYNVYNSVLS